MKVVSTPELQRLNNESRSAEFNRSLSDEAIERLDPNGQHILGMALLHEHAKGRKVAPHVRSEVILKFEGKETPEEGWLDIPLDTYERIS